MQRIVRIDVSHSNGVVSSYYDRHEAHDIIRELDESGKSYRVYSAWVHFAPDMYLDRHGDAIRVLEEKLGTAEYDRRDRERIKRQWGHNG